MLGIKLYLPETTTVGVISYAQLRIGDLRWRKYRHIVASNKFSGQTINTTQLTPACHQLLSYRAVPYRAVMNGLAFSLYHNAS